MLSTFKDMHIITRSNIIANMVNNNLSIKQIANKLDIGYSTVCAYKKINTLPDNVKNELIKQHNIQFSKVRSLSYEDDIEKSFNKYFPNNQLSYFESIEPVGEIKEETENIDKESIKYLIDLVEYKIIPIIDRIENLLDKYSKTKNKLINFIQNMI